jgi:homoserine acetyltransferase
VAASPGYTTNHAEDNRDLRIELMIGDIGENAFKQKIQQREKARQRQTDIRQVLEMLQTVLTDVFQTFMQTKDVGTLCHSLESLRDHVTEYTRYGV